MYMQSDSPRRKACAIVPPTPEALPRDGMQVLCVYYLLCARERAEPAVLLAFPPHLVTMRRRDWMRWGWLESTSTRGKQTSERIPVTR